MSRFEISVHDSGSNIELIIGDVNITFYQDNFTAFTYEENVDGVIESLAEAGISDKEIVAEVIDKIDYWISAHSE